MNTLHFDTFLPYMRDVSRCEQSLRELNLMWRMIEASAKMNCPLEAKAILPTIAATRAGFGRLEQDLVASLVREKVSNVLAEIGTKAQYVIDIVVRNLYERTADVGFLATDGELCAFVAGLHQDREAIHRRLQAYRRKYTVYDEIMLLDSTGKVRVQIDRQGRIEASSDPLIAQTLASDDYVETFRRTDLRPGQRHALVYSRRMLHPKTGAPAGILCLFFDFEAEMAGIFRSHRDPDERSVMLLLDGENRVIASADELWIPIGAVVPVNRDASPRLLKYGGREYLVRTFSAAGYQGYKGPPGWQGQVMIPLEVAFAASNGTSSAELDPALAKGLLSHARSFCPPLHAIITAAETIRRVVWNGQVMAAVQRGELIMLKAILEQIGETGNRSNELFARSIRELYETVMASALKDAEFTSRLLVDLLDRNLYERANDCRWWALTPELRAALALPEADAASLERIGEILEYINRLYTVYTRLFVYDRSGRIIAGSDANLDGFPAIGHSIDSATLARVSALASEQDYCVTPFTESPLYADNPTYIYHAAIRHADNPAMVTGGIGIVFDSGPELSAMLREALGNRAGMSAFFIDRQGRVISSTDDGHPIGSTLAIEPSLLALEKGSSASRIVIHDGQYAIMGCTASSGYREFKNSDGYRDDIIGVVFESFGAEREVSGGASQEEFRLEDVSVARGIEYATFLVDGGLYAIAAEHVLEALPGSEVSAMSMGRRPERIGILEIQRDSAEKQLVWVFDLGYLISGKLTAIDSGGQVIIVRFGQRLVGLLVNDLHAVPEFSLDQIVPTAMGGDGESQLVPRVIKANGGRLLIQEIDVACLFRMLEDAQLPADSQIACRAVGQGG